MFALAKRCVILLVGVAAAAPLAGCGSMLPLDYWEKTHREYREDEIHVYYASLDTVRAICLGGGVDARACAKTWPGACNIYIRADEKENTCILEHELKHCHGYDHPGHPRLAPC